MINLNKRPQIFLLIATIISVNFFAQFPEVTLAAPSANAQISRIKSYREWKHERIKDAQTKILTYKTQMDSQKSRQAAPGNDPNIKSYREHNIEAGTSKNISLDKLERELRHEEYALEVAKDLSVTDYFVGYLTKVKNKKAAFQEVAGKLSPDEVAELMTAYANSVFGSELADFPTNASISSKESAK